MRGAASCADAATPTRTAIKNLGYELNDVKKRSQGIITTGASISSKLTLVLKAFNESTKQTGLKIKSIDINEKNITISGYVSSRPNTTKFIDILKSTGLDVKSSNILPDTRTKGDNITLTLEPTN